MHNKNLTKKVRYSTTTMTKLSFSKDEKLTNNIKHELVYVFLEDKMRMSLAYQIYEYINHNHNFQTKEQYIKAYARQIVKILKEP